jgi:predicted CXXCH cytochrome family protein
MAVADCKKCHKAHMPKLVTYAADTPSENCYLCHKKALDLLGASETKHKPLTCAFCHQERHKMIPNCQDCHVSPHAAGIMEKFPKCGDCHNIAHDLNNWPVTQPKEATREVTKTKE